MRKHTAATRPFSKSPLTPEPKRAPPAGRFLSALHEEELPSTSNPQESAYYHFLISIGTPMKDCPSCSTYPEPLCESCGGFGHIPCEGETSAS